LPGRFVVAANQGCCILSIPIRDRDRAHIRRNLLLGMTHRSDGFRFCALRRRFSVTGLANEPIQQFDAILRISTLGQLSRSPLMCDLVEQAAISLCQPIP
jgi:hypothetical protein